MAVRTIPTQHYGKNPVDRFIQRGSSHPQRRWVVGANKFPNITAARLYAANIYNIKDVVDFHTVSYVPGTGYKWGTDNSTNKIVKQLKPFTTNTTDNPTVSLATSAKPDTKIINAGAGTQTDIDKSITLTLHTKQGVVEVHGKFSSDEVGSIVRQVMV
jgi:hypothetical protein